MNFRSEYDANSMWGPDVKKQDVLQKEKLKFLLCSLCFQGMECCKSIEKGTSV